MALKTVSRNLLTYSALATFRNCPRKYKNRYIDHLRPVEKQPALFFGQVIHQALTLYYRSQGNLKPAYEYIQQCFADDKPARLLALVMLTAYADQYSQDDLDVPALDVEFHGEIRNPKTNGRSQTFVMAGKANGIVRIRGELYLLEHRTASSAEELDHDRLWADTQAALYCHYLRQNGYPIVGVVYNTLLKSRLQQKPGETETEFAQRCEELAAKNKSGKTTARRQMPETDEEFVARLKEWYLTHEAFDRVVFRFTEDRLSLLQEEVWEVTQQYLGSRRRRQWLPNTSQCFHYNRPCEYLKYCQSGFNPELCEILFEHVPPHEELPILGVKLREEERERYEKIRREKERRAAVNRLPIVQ